MKTDLSSTRSVEILHQGEQLKRDIAACRLDTNESFLAVHSIMASAFADRSQAITAPAFQHAFRELAPHRRMLECSAP